MYYHCYEIINSVISSDNDRVKPRPSQCVYKFYKAYICDDLKTRLNDRTGFWIHLKRNVVGANGHFSADHPLGQGGTPGRLRDHGPQPWRRGADRKSTVSVLPRQRHSHQQVVGALRHQVKRQEGFRWIHGPGQARWLRHTRGTVRPGLRRHQSHDLFWSLREHSCSPGLCSQDRGPHEMDA